jgi:hypothetical protein
MDNASHRIDSFDHHFVDRNLAGTRAADAMTSNIAHLHKRKGRFDIPKRPSLIIQL